MRRVSEKDLGRALADGAELAGCWQRLPLLSMSISPGDTLRALAIAPLIGCGELSKRVRGSMRSKNYCCGLVQSIILQRIRRGEGEERGYGGLPVALQLISKLWR